jgi:hypothetical protein
MSEKATVTFAVLGLQHVRDKGRLLGLAAVEVVVEGVSFTLQGVRVIYEPDGSLLASRRASATRSTAGSRRWCCRRSWPRRSRPRCWRRSRLPNEVPVTSDRALDCNRR